MAPWVGRIAGAGVEPISGGGLSVAPAADGHVSHPRSQFGGLEAV
jgi:hypothetical protein